MRKSERERWRVRGRLRERDGRRERVKVRGRDKSWYV